MSADPILAPGQSISFSPGRVLAYVIPIAEANQLRAELKRLQDQAALGQPELQECVVRLTGLLDILLPTPTGTVPDEDQAIIVDSE